MPFPLLAGVIGFVRSLITYIKTWFIHKLLGTLATGPVPRHIGFVMDGNRRWARERGMQGKEGHTFGIKAACWVLELCIRLRIQCVSMYAFSIENFNRPKDEVETLTQVITDFTYLAEPGNLFDKNNVRVNVLGRRELFPKSVQAAFERAEDLTRNNDSLILNFCAAYTSQDEITMAIESVIRKAIDTGDLDGSKITEDSITSQLSTSLVGSPPLDIFIRTSGVKRLGGFLTWQCCENTQIHTVDTLWPDFGLWRMVPIILEYQRKVWAKERKCTVVPSSKKQP